MRVLGVMSGTSFDSIDVAAAQFSPDGQTLEMSLLGHVELDMPETVHDLIAAMVSSGDTTLAAVARLDAELGQVFAEAAAHGLNTLCGGVADLICCPGQTVYHWVQDGRARGSLQLGEPTWIAERTQLPVISNLYNRDIAAGGQGAPLTGVFDRLLLEGVQGNRATLNLGGIANMTVVTEKGGLSCYDVGPANALLDAAVGRITGGRERLDRNGERAAAGSVHEELLRVLFDNPFFAQEPPKSTGKELFNLEYVDRATASIGAVNDADLLATLTRFTAEVVAHECRRWGLERLVVSGGGVQNPVLMDQLRVACAPTSLVTSQALGLPVTSVEAYTLAFLGYLCASGIAAGLPELTGSRHPSLLGSVTPGVTVPHFVPQSTPPTHLRLRQPAQH
jgi:anhydro-N-acetylmuramic acid kinase